MRPIEWTNGCFSQILRPYCRVCIGLHSAHSYGSLHGGAKRLAGSTPVSSAYQMISQTRQNIGETKTFQINVLKPEHQIHAVISFGESWT
jgi:hypothetical protein